MAQGVQLLPVKGTYRDDCSTSSLEFEVESDGAFAGQGKIIAGFFIFVTVMLLIQHGKIWVPFLQPENAVYFPIVVTFVAGYAIIILEETTGVNKAATSLVL